MALLLTNMQEIESQDQHNQLRDIFKIRFITREFSQTWVIVDKKRIVKTNIEEATKVCLLPLTTKIYTEMNNTMNILVRMI